MRNYKIAYYIVSAALVVCLVFTFSFYNQISSLETRLEDNYQSAFADFVNETENLSQLCLKAGVFSSMPQGMSLMTQINDSAVSAVQKLSSMPFEQQYISELGNYYNQLGDYALSCYDILVRGDDLGAAQVQQLAAFSEDLQEVNTRLSELQSVMYGDSMRFADMQPMGSYLDIENIDNGEYGISYVFSDLNNYFSKKEALNYSGRYSDNMQQLKPVGLQGGEVDINMAKQEAVSFLQAIGKQYTAESLLEIGESDSTSTMPCFYFSINEDVGDINIAVSKACGKLINYYNNRSVIEQVLTAAEARSIAEKLVNAAGYEAMEVFKKYKNGNEMCFEFNFRDTNEVLYYPDKLLVEIALDTGELMSFEAHEYYMNHTERQLAEPIVLREVAEAGLLEGLEVQKSSMSLVADGKGKEVLCYEFRVKQEDESYIMHISTEDGSEQQLLYCFEDEENFYTR